MKRKRPKGREIRFPASEVRKFIRQLNTLVVSLDRLGSSYYDDPARHAAELERFFVEAAAFRILARMRGSLADAYESGMSQPEIRRFEGQAGTWRVWNFKDRMGPIGRRRYAAHLRRLRHYAGSKARRA
jgi:hypothetical protein